MGQPYVGEIRMFCGNFAPVGWMLCDGTPLPISENETLFTLIGTTYGGDGQSTFNLPDLRGHLPLHKATGFTQGQAAGVEEVTLTIQQTPVHNHALVGTTGTGSQASPTNSVPAASNVVSLYASGTPTSQFAAQMVQPSGGSQPHTNLQPYLCVNFIISLFGIFPPPQ